MTADQPAWRADALCAQIGGEAWYPEKGDSTRDAKAVCARCPVREACLQDALDRGERFGVWGGLSPSQREKLGTSGRMQRVDAARCGTPSGYNRHRRIGEDACRACKQANRLAHVEYREKRRAGAA